MKEGENMSLTNEQITAQNFKDFYDQIRPYLNGQVPTFANSFSRSDILSTTEKIVGTDTDGMPIYQKTEVVSNPTKDSWISFGTSLTGCNIIGIFGSLLFSNGLTFDVPYNSGDSYVYINKKTDADGGELVYKISAGGNVPTLMKVTLRYTKTGDTPIKVGTGNDYSTDEQIVGSWIDGKPLYQKTIDCGANPTGAQDGTVIATIPEMGIGFIKCAYLSNNEITVSLPRVIPTSVPWEISVNISNKDIVYNSGASTASYGNVIVTVCYTKTTD